MPRLEQVALALLLGAVASTARAADEAPFRYSAPITLQQSGAFVQMALPVGAYAHSAQPGLRDLRVVDARGERVPFALLAPRQSERQLQQRHAATLYPLPPKPASGGTWTSPVEVQVQGDRVRVIGKGGRAAAAPARSGGWLIDLGERAKDDPLPQSLQLQWSGPDEFSAAFSFETSDDLRAWRLGGHGQLLALRGADGPLTQPLVMLPAHGGRFVRLVWADIASAPALTGAQVIASASRSQPLDPPAELTIAASAEPAGGGTTGAAPVRAAHFDLGAALPVVQLDLKLAPGTHVVPARVQGRSRSDEPWRDLGATVFYRLDRGGDSSSSPPLALEAAVRYVRVVPDARAAAMPDGTQLTVKAQLLGLVFVAQGQPPFALQAGSANAAPSALPVSTLVPALDDERARFGRAELGTWSEVAEVARAQAAQQKMAALRPWLLWAVLVIGVALLALMVWKLARDKPARVAHDA
jgi:hypothetical protein